MSWGLNWFRDQPIYNIRTPLIGKVQKINDIAGEVQKIQVLEGEVVLKKPLIGQLTKQIP